MLKYHILALFLFISSPSFALQTTKVSTSIRPVAMLVKSVVGDEIPVQILLPGSVSPHDYQLRFSDIKLIKESDVFFWVGPTLESGISKAVNNHGSLNAIKLMGVSGLHWPSSFSKHHHHHHHHEEHKGELIISEDVHDYRDPHIWLSPRNAIKIVTVINNSLGKIYPENKITFDKNTNNFKSSMKSLDKLIGDRLKEVEKKGFLVAHDGYRHFVDHYGLNQLGVIDLTDDISSSAKHKGKLNRLSDKTSCIFTDPQHSSKSANQLAEKFDISSRKLDLMGHDIPLKKNSYIEFLGKFSETVVECLK
ncbi:MAG: hypothetical protein CMK44_02195 [Porticoccus sp.]|jgi:zinc transport system substrate-binding protein|nr:hypothetical protein [Porticoccus sp.]